MSTIWSRWFFVNLFLLQWGTAVVKSGRLKLAQTYGPIVLPHIYTDKKKYTFRIYLSDFTGWGSFHVFQFWSLFSTFCDIFYFLETTKGWPFWVKSVMLKYFNMTITESVSRKYIQSFDKRKKIKISWLFPFLLFASIVTFQCDQMKHYFLYLNMLALLSHWS